MRSDRRAALIEKVQGRYQELLMAGTDTLYEATLEVLEILTEILADKGEQNGKG